MIPAMKHAVARYSGQSEWRTVRPPLVALDEATAAKVEADLRAIGFDMPGYPRSANA